MMTNTLKLFHTSPKEIESINNRGRFGEFLFFASSPYSISAAAADYVYSIEIDETEIIEARSLFYQDDSDTILKPLVDDVVERLEVDEETAMGLIDGSVNIYEISEDDDNAETSWDLQQIAAEAAKLLGYRGVEMIDEQGAVWLINMLGKESELKND